MSLREYYGVEQWSRVDSAVCWIKPDFLDDALVPNGGAIHVPQLAYCEPSVRRLVIDLLLSILQARNDFVCVAAASDSEPDVGDNTTLKDPRDPACSSNNS